MKKTFLLAMALVVATVGFSLRGRLQRLNPPSMSAASTDPAWKPSAPVQPWRYIVIHDSGTEVGGATRFEETVRERGTDELGYHFVIGNGSDTADGEIEPTARWLAQEPGDHARTADHRLNEQGIGICLVGNLDSYPPSKAQSRSLERLVRHLCKHYAIPAGRIYTHSQVTGRERCPGARFDVDRLRAAVK